MLEKIQNVSLSELKFEAAFFFFVVLDKTRFIEIKLGNQ